MHDQQRRLIGRGACQNRVYHTPRHIQTRVNMPEVLSARPQIARLTGLRVGYILTEVVQEMAMEVADMMKERLGIRGKDLAGKLRHTGRMMPKRIKQEVRILAEATALTENPKLSRMVDHERVEVAYQSCMTFLQAVDVADRRKGVVLGILGSLAMALLVVTVLVLSVLMWRGFL